MRNRGNFFTARVVWCLSHSFLPRRSFLPEVNMPGAGVLYWEVLFGAIGVGYFIYGKKQGKYVPLLTGIALCAYPYFFSSAVPVVIIGVVLSAVPYFFRE